MGSNHATKDRTYRAVAQQVAHSHAMCICISIFLFVSASFSLFFAVRVLMVC